MKCGGCVSRVQRLLEQEPDVQKVCLQALTCHSLHMKYGAQTSCCCAASADHCSLAVQASVNLAMETALVRVVLLPNAVPDGVSGWRQLVQAAGERLAQVTHCPRETSTGPCPAYAPASCASWRMCCMRSMVS